MRALAALVLALAWGGATGVSADDEIEYAPPLDAPEIPDLPPRSDALLRLRALGPDLAEAQSYLNANVQDRDGGWAYVHFTPEDMPLTIAVGRPKEPPRIGSSADAREAALEGVRVWVRALRPYIPWFAVNFVEQDPDADVVIEWRRRMTGSAAGRGGLVVRVEDGRLVVKGELQLSTRPNPRGSRLTTDRIRLIVAHEFGDVLGLSHCLDCDSAMNYSWHTRDRILVTQNDVKTYLHLLAQPNGERHDGGLLAGLAKPGWSLGRE